MVSTNVAVNEYAQGSTRFVLKSRSDTHLSVRVHRPGCPESKKKFSAIELKRMAFKQEILSDPERFGSFVGRYSELFQGQENPLKGTHPAGFCYGIGEKNPYHQAHPEWCLAVQKMFPDIGNASPYKRRFADCRAKLALTDTEEGVSDYDRDQLDKIRKAVQTICDELGKKARDERVIIAAMLTLHEKVYHLLVMPIRETLACTSIRFSEALSEVERYRNDEGVHYCLGRCFAKREDLVGNYQGMLQGRYASLEEVPRDFSDGKIHRRSYLEKLARLLKGCEAYEADHDHDRFLNLLQPYLNSPEEHLQTKVVPLLIFGQCVKNILLWPRIFPLSDGERKYILDNLYFLSAIANSTFPGVVKIPYNYLSISSTDKESAKTLLKTRNAVEVKKRQACRTLLHARIPWQALCTVGTFLHRSGGVPETAAESRRQQVSDAIVDLVDELKIVDQMIDALISFELTEFSKEPLPEVKEPPEGCYKHLLCLAAKREEERSLEKINRVLRRWDNIPTVADMKMKFAMLRTLQVLGEMCKNLGEYGSLSDDDIWAKLEELRDLLSHSERFIVAKRIERLLEDDRIFSQLQDDFRALKDYFQHLTKDKTYFALTGLEDVYMRLTEKISCEITGQLVATATGAEARQRRSRMAAIQSELYALLDTQALLDNYVEEIALLPLTNSQKERLRKVIQTLISPQAAKNNATNEKVSVKKSIRAILAECKKSPLLQDSLSTLDQALAKLDSGDILDVQPLLQTINWKGYKRDKIEEIYALLSRLRETVDDYVARASEEFQSLLKQIIIVDSPQQLIRDLQLGPVTKEALTLRLMQLGVVNQTLWMQTLEKLQRKTPQEVQPVEKRGTIETIKKSAIECIEFILHRLHHLDRLCPKGQHGLSIFQRDPLLQLACEYFTADFRAKASLLEDGLETIRQLRQDLPQQMIQEVQSTLLSAIERANEMLHVHHVTEPGTVTEEGRIFYLHMFISQLLVTYTTTSGVTLPSLEIKLNELKAVLAQASRFPP